MAPSSTIEVQERVVYRVESRTRVVETARQRLATGCPYAFYFSKVDCEYRDGVLTLRGQVPTFYLKQVLQTRLMDIAGVARINNEVDVISSVGLSSVRAK